MAPDALTPVVGTVISVHAHGATVRLEDGSLAVVPARELEANRPTYVASRDARKPLALVLAARGRPVVALRAPDLDASADPRAGVDRREDETESLASVRFEEQMIAFLKATDGALPPDRLPPLERHFIRKKRRAAFFEARKPSA